VFSENFKIWLINVPIVAKALREHKLVKSRQLQCWRCPDGITIKPRKIPYLGYGFNLTAGFCANPQCNLLNVSIRGIQQVITLKQVNEQIDRLNNLNLTSKIPELVGNPQQEIPVRQIEGLINHWNSPEVNLKISESEEVVSAYKEACKSFIVGNYRGAVLECRSIIAYVAIYKGHKPKDKHGGFTKPIKYLLGKKLTSYFGAMILNEIREKVGFIAHRPMKVSELEAFGILLSLDLVLKDIYSETRY